MVKVKDKVHGDQSPVLIQVAIFKNFIVSVQVQRNYGNVILSSIVPVMKIQNKNTNKKLKQLYKKIWIRANYSIKYELTVEGRLKRAYT